MKLTKLLIIFVFIFILSLILVNNVYAETYFNDNFDSGSLNKWEVINGLGKPINSWRIENGKLVGEIKRGQSSYLKALTGKNLDNFIIETDVINNTGVDQSILFNVSSDFSKYYMLNVRYKDPYWPQDRNNFLFGKTINGKYYNLVNIHPNYDITQGVTHKLKIIVNGDNVKIIFDSIQVIDINDSDIYLKEGMISLMNWGGDYYRSNTKNVFDNFKITSLDNKPNKIIIIPGMGASWNSNALVYGQSVSNDQWTMTPFVKNYDGLISSLNSNSLIKDQDYFIWNYDWRKPLKDISLDLNSFINTKIGQSGVDLVGHSLGGLVARLWGQDHLSDGRNINVYTLGSPNGGSLEAYEAWSGGKISDYPSISSIALNIILQLNKKNNNNNIQSFRNFVPSLKDLIPTSDFIKKKNQVVSLNSLQNNNSYLIEKNNEAKNLRLNLTSYVGTGQKTKEFINLIDQSFFDKALEIWPDGRPSNYIYGDGDSTVLKKNAFLTQTNPIQLKSNHGEIVNKSLSDLLTKLGLSGAGNFISEDFSNTLIFFIGSPANISVTCDLDSPVFEQNGFVIIKNKNYKKCLVNLKGIGSGDYHLVTASTNDGDWHYFQNKIEINENSQLIINPINGDLLIDDSNILFLKKLISGDINLLINKYGNNINLNNSLNLLQSNNISGLISSIFSFRKEKNENELTIKIIDNSKILFEMINKDYIQAVAKTNYIKSIQDKSLVDKLTQLNIRKGMVIKENSAQSYKKAEDLIINSDLFFKSKNYSKSFVYSLVASKYLSEVW